MLLLCRTATSITLDNQARSKPSQLSPLLYLLCARIGWLQRVRLLRHYRRLSLLLFWEFGFWFGEIVLYCPDISHNFSNVPRSTFSFSKLPFHSSQGYELKWEPEPLTTSNTTRIIRLQLGQTAISSPSRRSDMPISKRSPHGQG